MLERLGVYHAPSPAVLASAVSVNTKLHWEGVQSKSFKPTTNKWQCDSSTMTPVTLALVQGVEHGDYVSGTG